MTELIQKAMTYTNESYGNCVKFVSGFALIFLVLYIICVISRYKKCILGVCMSFLMLVAATGISGRSFLLRLEDDLETEKRQRKAKTDQIILSTFGGKSQISEMKVTLAEHGVAISDFTDIKNIENIENELAAFMGSVSEEYEQANKP